MLHDELEIAVNDLIVALREASHAYETAGGIAGNPGLSDSFAAARERREALATSLEGELRALGYLPKDADSEKELVRDVVTHLKATLSDDEAAALLEERRLDEERILSCARAVLDRSPPDGLRAVVTQAMESAQTQARALSAIASSSKGDS